MDLQLVLSNLNIKTGEDIKVNGRVMPEAKSFAVDIGQNDYHLMLHFNPRFDAFGDTKTIVMNSKECGNWGEELRVLDFPFQQGKETTISISFDEKEVRVKLPEDLELTFPNRENLESAGFLSVAGDFNIKSIEFN